MSDDDDQRRSSGGSFDTIPPELRPYMGKEERPKIQRRGEDPELDAAFDALLALSKEEEKQVIDPTRGIGNATGYLAPIVVPKNADKSTVAQKVEVAVADQPKQLPAGDPDVADQLKQLPAGDPELATEAVKTRGFQGMAAKSTSGTDRTTTPMEVSSSPASTSTSTSTSTREEGRRTSTSTGVVAGLLLIGVAAALGMWAMQKGSPRRVGADAAASALTATGSPEAPAPVSASASSSSIEEGPAPHIAPSTSVAVPPEPTSVLAPKQGGHAALPRASDDPYKDAAVVPPVKTAAPSAQPAPTAPPTPPDTPTPTTPEPKPPQTQIKF